MKIIKVHNTENNQRIVKILLKKVENVCEMYLNEKLIINSPKA